MVHPGSFDSVKTSIWAKDFRYFYALRTLIVFEDTGHHTRQCQGTAIEGVGELTFPVRILVAQF